MGTVKSTRICMIPYFYAMNIFIGRLRDKMEERRICKSYDIKKLNEGDVDKILDLCSKNILFYQYHPQLVICLFFINTNR